LSLIGCTKNGEIIKLYPCTGVGTLINILPNSCTEIEYINKTKRAWYQFPNGENTIQEFNITNATIIGPEIINNAAFTGLEYVDCKLYGVSISRNKGPSSFSILNR
jgi:hypothetical protein